MTSLKAGAVIMMMSIALSATAVDGPERDVIKTPAGDLEITFIGHASLMLRFGGKTIHVDPYDKLADYLNFPKADLILLTHEHGDHCDSAALSKVRKADTTVVLTAACAGKVRGGTVMTNGESRAVMGIGIDAVPAYNLVNKQNGRPFHPKGSGNGYVLSFGDFRLYIAGDTENTPEMKALKRIDCAFLPMNLPYTMTPEMVADAARAFRPGILYPYHYSDTDASTLTGLLKDTGIEVRIRAMK